MDFRLSDLGDGGAITALNGDIEQDETFLTAIYNSLFCGDCFYNIYSDYPTDTSFEEAIQAPINVQNFKTAQTAAYNLLEWMIDKGIADSIEVIAKGSETENKINVDITMTEPDGDNKVYSIFWQNGKKQIKRTV